MLAVPYKANDYPDLITDLNDVLHKLGFDLKQSKDPMTGKPHLLFVNTQSDLNAQVASEYNPQELSYYKMLVRL